MPLPMPWASVAASWDCRVVVVVVVVVGSGTPVVPRDRTGSACLRNNKEKAESGRSVVGRERERETTLQTMPQSLLGSSFSGYFFFSFFLLSVCRGVGQKRNEQRFERIYGRWIRTFIGMGFFVFLVLLLGVETAVLAREQTKSTERVILGVPVFFCATTRYPSKHETAVVQYWTNDRPTAR